MAKDPAAAALRDLKVRVPKALMDKINDYRHEAKLETRSEAVIALLVKALDTEAEKENGG